MSENAGKTVAEILNGKRGAIFNAPLKRGSPSWDDMMDLPWEEIVDRAQRRIPGYQTFRKLLTDERFDK